MQVIAAVFMHQSEAKFIKTKLAAAKVPHVLAHVAVGKEVKTKAKIALAKTAAAVSDHMFLSLLIAIGLIILIFENIGQSIESCCTQCHHRADPFGQENSCPESGWCKGVESCEGSQDRQTG